MKKIIDKKSNSFAFAKNAFDSNDLVTENARLLGLE